MTKIQHLDSKDNPTNAHYHFEGAKQNPAGFDLNKRVCAVYQLSGYIHQTCRNHPDNTDGKPYWQYINQDGTLTEFESDHSAKGVERKLLDALKGSKDPTLDLGEDERKHLNCKDDNTNGHYYFEDAQQDSASSDLNNRVTAVYQLAGYIHQTLRNHPDFTVGKPHWQYIKKNDALTEFESDLSAEDVKNQIIG